MGLPLDPFCAIVRVAEFGPAKWRVGYNTVTLKMSANVSEMLCSQGLGTPRHNAG
jgi:hypothetical protein